MDLKSYKNEYGYMRVDCPFCGKSCYLRESTKINPDPLRELKRHITNQAKNEALAWYLSQESNGDTKHMEYYKQHTKDKIKKVITEGRQYDNELQFREIIWNQIN